MSEEAKNRPPLKDRLGGFLKTKKGQKILVILLIAAAAITALSDLIPKRTSSSQSTQETLTAEEYEAALEARLKVILESMSGVGECSVMITLTGSGETVYVSENKESTNTDKNTDGGERSSHQKEETYIIIEDESGGQTALSRRYIMPEVGGVLVVCDGGNSPTVREKVVNAVKTALKTGSDRIYVTDKG